MYGLSIVVTLIGALALAGCSDGAKESKGEKGEPGPPGPKGEPGVAGTTLRVVAPQSSTASCQTDEIMISAYCARDGATIPAAANSMGTTGASCEGDEVDAVVVCAKR